MTMTLLLWFIPALACYAILVARCDWFAALAPFIRRRDEYALFATLALLWPITAVVAIARWQKGTP